MTTQAAISGDAVGTSRLLNAIFILLRTTALHGPRHPLAIEVAGRLVAAVIEARPPFALQFVVGGVFRDRAMVSLDLETFIRATEIARAVHNLAIDEIAFDGPFVPAAAIEIGRVLARGAQGPADELDGLRIPGVRWREIPNARRGVDSEAVDPEIAAITQITLAIADAEQVDACRADAWPWSLGLSVVRRVDRSIMARFGAAGRTIEIAPGEWSVARRAVSACVDVLSILTAINVTAPTRRAAAHVVFALSMQGYADREGMAATEAAIALASRLGGAVGGRSRAEPHRILVATLVHQMTLHSSEGAGGRLGVVPLVHLAYELERRRRPRGVSFDLAKIDLLAYAASEMDRAFSAIWVRSLISTVGVVPPGATVRLDDGRVGIVLGPGDVGDPWCPEVLVGGERVKASAPVTLVTPLNRRQG